MPVRCTSWQGSADFVSEMKARLQMLLGRKIVSRLNDLPIRRKLMTLFLFCVLLPLLITDSLVLWMLTSYQKESIRHDTGNAAAYYLRTTVEDSSRVARSIYLNRRLNEFLDEDFGSTLDYFNRYQDLAANMMLSSSLWTGKIRFTMYADNDTLVNGGLFRRLEDRQAEWYQALANSRSDVTITAYYDDSRPASISDRRQFSLIRRMNYYPDASTEKIVKVDIDYSSILQDLRSANYDADIYICMNGQLLFSNIGENPPTAPFEAIPEHLSHADEIQIIGAYGQELTLYVVDRHIDLRQFLQRNWLPILLLVLLNLAIPTGYIHYMNRSFAERLQLLTDTVRMADGEQMPLAEPVSGADEIGVLMDTYNKMAQRTNRLIETVYKSRLREQESDLARQQAELLALHSQSNPHFLFNALESIRMRGLVKQENETAEMIGLLALIERQYVDWRTDTIPLGEELRYVEAYLRLQKYRFGDRFAYRISQQEDCRELSIPKLSLLTFVENACVHGIAGKEQCCWVFVRTRRTGDDILLEVEDTGIGIPEGECQRLEDRMNQADIRMLRENEHVGIVNACLRMKMALGGEVRFTIESEEQVGSTFTIVLTQPEPQEEGGMQPC